jgi:hypothetical protein
MILGIFAYIYFTDKKMTFIFETNENTVFDIEAMNCIFTLKQTSDFSEINKVQITSDFRKKLIDLTGKEVDKSEFSIIKKKNTIYIKALQKHQS